MIDLTSDGETDVTFSPRASAVSVNQQSSSFRRLRRVPDAQTSVIGRPIERPPSASPNDAPLSSRPDSPLVVASVTLSHSPSPSTGGSFLASSQSASLLSRHTTQPPTYSRPAQPFNATAESVRAEFFELARIYGWLENPAMAKQVLTCHNVSIGSTLTLPPGYAHGGPASLPLLAACCLVISRQQRFAPGAAKSTIRILRHQSCSVGATALGASHALRPCPSFFR